MIKTIEFEVSGKKMLESDEFTYAILIEKEEELPGIEALISELQISEVDIAAHKYLISQTLNERYKVKLLKINSRPELDQLVKRLVNFDSINAGIIHLSVDSEAHESILINELLEKAHHKALEYAKVFSKHAIELVGFKIKEKQGGWQIYPPLSSLDRNSLYSAILSGRERSDQFVIDKTIEVKFQVLYKEKIKKVN